MSRRLLSTIALTALALTGCSGGGSKNSGGTGGGEEETGGKMGGTGGSATGGKMGGTGGAATGGQSGGGTGGSSGGTGGGGTTPDAAAPDAGGDSAGGATGDTAPGVSPKMSFFLTSRKGGGNLGGLEGADMICKQLATAVGVGNKTWHAYLSTQSPMVHARDRIGMGPWFNVKGEMVAMNLADLHDGAMPRNNLTAMTVLDEKGQMIPGRMNRPAGTDLEHDIITGTQMDGTVVMGQTCGDWKMEMATARVGHFDRGGGGGTLPMTSASSWNSSHNNMGCSPETIKPGGGAGRFYCFATD